MAAPLYAFVGGGNMGRALVGGLLAAGHPAAAIRVADPLAESRAACAAEHGITTFEDNAPAVAGADVVVLAVKPQQLRAVALALAPHGTPATLYLSIAAGITTGHLATWLGAGRAIVRAMPNTPALIGCGAAGLFANAHVNAAQRALADQLLGAVGRSLWLEDEGLLDAVTALSGSGPAYYFLLIEHMQAAGVALGLPAAVAAELARETAYGACRLARESSLDAATLRRQVTSPGGTTERALASFAAAGFGGIVESALVAARDRAVELAALVER